MEIRGVIAGLQSLKKSSKVVITTDSQYTINGIQK
jgi:ribonuclease HI